MTTLAKVEANQRNAQLSTGPRTTEGKAVVARNAIRHGIFASVPVIPGECPGAWEAHRAGVVESLAPVGLIEVNLAERAALLLWRLHRLARYEAETVAAALEDADVPPLPPPADEFDSFPKPPAPPTREDQLRDIRRGLRKARAELAGVVPARDYLRSPPEPDAAVPSAVAAGVLEAACARAEVAEGLRADPPAVGSKALLRKLGLAGGDPEAVAWTAELVARGLAVFAGYARESPGRFRAGVEADLDESAEELGRAVRRLEGEADAVARLLDDGASRKRAARLLPGDGRDERIAKYERHLHTLLTSTLHELERLQARRAGESVPLPGVADVTVTVGRGRAEEPGGFVLADCPSRSSGSSPGLSVVAPAAVPPAGLTRSAAPPRPWGVRVSPATPTLPAGIAVFAIFGDRSRPPFSIVTPAGKPHRRKSFLLR